MSPILVNPYVFRPPAFDPLSPGGLKIWLKQGGPFYSDAGSTLQTTNGGSIYRWEDSSGNGNHADQSASGSRPTLTTGALNGYGVSTHDADVGQYYNLPDLSALTSGEFHIVFRTDNDPPADFAHSGAWRLGTAGFNTHMPEPGGSPKDDFGTVDRKNPGAFGAGFLSSAYRIYGASSIPSLWHDYISGVIHSGDTLNTVAFPSAPTLGKSISAFYLDGRIASFLLYDHKLTDPERAGLVSYLQTAFGIT